MKRYQMILLPCEYTSKSSWGKIYSHSHTILDLNIQRESWQMEVEIVDTKTGKKYTIDEIFKIQQDLYSKGKKNNDKEYGESRCF